MAKLVLAFTAAFGNRSPIFAIPYTYSSCTVSRVIYRGQTFRVDFLSTNILPTNEATLTIYLYRSNHEIISTNWLYIKSQLQMFCMHDPHKFDLMNIIETARMVIIINNACISARVVCLEISWAYIHVYIYGGCIDSMQ